MQRIAVIGWTVAGLAGCGGVPPENAVVEKKTGALAAWECNPPAHPIYSDPLYSPCWRGLSQCMAPNNTGAYLDPLLDIKMGSEGKMSGPSRIWVNVPGRGAVLGVQDRTQPNTPVSRVQFYANNWSASPSVPNQNWGIVNIGYGRTTGSCGQVSNQFSMACWGKVSGSPNIPVRYVVLTSQSQTPPQFPAPDYFQFQGSQGYWQNTQDVVCQTYAYIGPVGSGATDPANWWPFQFIVPAYAQVWYETGENGEQCFYRPGDPQLDHTKLHSQLQNIPYIPAGDPRDIMVFDAIYTMSCSP
jgi:hypothetical protein